LQKDEYREQVGQIRQISEDVQHGENAAASSCLDGPRILGARNRRIYLGTIQTELDIGSISLRAEFAMKCSGH